MSDGNWIKGAIHHHGALRKKAQAAGESTAQFARARDGDKGKTGEQARLAETLMHLRPAKTKTRLGAM